VDDESGEQNEHAASDEHEQKAPAGDAPPAPVDLATLTAKVYRLLLEDLRLDRARGAR
jgi:hypothetical protein